MGVPIDISLAESIGKKGSENSMIFYNRKVGDDVIVALAPSSASDRFYAVAEILLVSEQIILSTASIDALFGEVLIACSLLNKRVLLTDDNDASKLLNEVKLSNYDICSRNDVVQKITEYAVPAAGKETRIDIDRAFPVKGIGTVALGIVTSGTLKVHDELFHVSGKKALIRSIQSQDKDVDHADKGTRAGLALKGIEHDDIQKGDMLCSNKLELSNKILVSLTQSATAKETITQGNYYDIFYNFIYTRARVESISGTSIELKSERPIPKVSGDLILFGRSKVPRIFAKGVIV